MTRSNSSWEKQFFDVRSAEYASKAAIEKAYTNGETSQDLDLALAKIRASLPEKPQYIRRDLAEYQKGFRACYEDGKIAFLYAYKGDLYSVRSSAWTGFPSWETIPRADWQQFSEGAFYWVYPDKAPVLCYLVMTPTE